MIEIRVPNRDLDAETLQGVGLKVGDFPRILAQREFEAALSLGGQASVTSTMHDVRGFLFINDTQRRAFQARRDGFTYSRLHGYTSWQELRDEARDAWHHYVTATAPERTLRLGVRYINRIRIPSEASALADWFKIYPQFPRELGPIDGFNEHISLSHSVSPEHKAIVNFRPAPFDGGPFRFFIYDIQAWLDQEVPAASADIWDILEDLREFKNDLFFGFMGPKLKESLQ
ncbi:MAG: TIGR04255 family protein [Nannocystis sp.]|nr:TIGR04255 family protein [Nannocystis sp.]